MLPRILALALLVIGAFSIPDSAQGQERQVSPEPELLPLVKMSHAVGRGTDFNADTAKRLGMTSITESLFLHPLNVNRQAAEAEGRFLFLLERTESEPPYIVLFKRGESAGIVFLTSPRGDLSKVLKWEKDEEASLVEINENVKANFAAETKFWLDRAKEWQTKAKELSDQKLLVGVWAQHSQHHSGTGSWQLISEFRVSLNDGRLEMKEHDISKLPANAFRTQGLTDMTFDGTYWTFKSDWGKERGVAFFKLRRVDSDTFEGYATLDGKKQQREIWRRVSK